MTTTKASQSDRTAASRQSSRRTIVERTRRPTDRRTGGGVRSRKSRHGRGSTIRRADPVLIEPAGCQAGITRRAGVARCPARSPSLAIAFSSDASSPCGLRPPPAAGSALGLDLVAAGDDGAPPPAREPRPLAHRALGWHDRRAVDRRREHELVEQRAPVSARSSTSISSSSVEATCTFTRNEWSPVTRWHSFDRRLRPQAIEERFVVPPVDIDKDQGGQRSPDRGRVDDRPDTRPARRAPQAGEPARSWPGWTARPAPPAPSWSAGHCPATRTVFAHPAYRLSTATVFRHSSLRLSSNWTILLSHPHRAGERSDDASDVRAEQRKASTNILKQSRLGYAMVTRIGRSATIPQTTDDECCNHRALVAV